MRVLITGANGFIGKNARVRLDDAPAPIPFDKRNAPNWTNSETIQVLTLDKEGDCDLKVDLAEGFDWVPPKKVDAVIHLAAKSGVRSFSPEDHDNNVESTQNLLRWMTRNDVPMIVYASSSSVYGNCTQMSEGWLAAPLSPYAHSKWVCEKLVSGWARQAKMIAVTYRIFNAIGKWQREDMFPALIAKHLHEMLHQPSEDHCPELDVFGSRWRTWTYVGDVVNGLWSALNAFYLSSKGTDMLFNLGSTNCMTQRSLIELFESQSQLKTNIVQREPHSLDVQKTKPDMAHFTAVMGWEPNNRNVDLGVREILNQYGLAVKT